MYWSLRLMMILKALLRSVLIIVFRNYALACDDNKQHRCIVSEFENCSLNQALLENQKRIWIHCMKSQSNIGSMNCENSLRIFNAIAVILNENAEICLNSAHAIQSKAWCKEKIVEWWIFPSVYIQKPLNLKWLFKLWPQINHIHSHSHSVAFPMVRHGIE